MIKLLSWEEFVLKVSTELGLCSNIYNVYGDSAETRFIRYMQSLGLHTSYPIGVGGYLKFNGVVGKKWFRAGTRTRNSKLYFNTDNLYTGMQGALRHNLYVGFCQWLLINYPNSYQLSVSD